MSEQEHYCELHDWQTIGMISTDTATFAIVDPCYSDALTKRWEYRVSTLQTRPFPNFEEHKLPSPYGGGESAVLFKVPGDGGWDVEARFCDEYGDGHMSICELRIRVHRHDLDDVDEDDE